jgi:hypothetical protein
VLRKQTHFARIVAQFPLINSYNILSVGPNIKIITGEAKTNKNAVWIQPMRPTYKLTRRPSRQLSIRTQAKFQNSTKESNLGAAPFSVVLHKTK